MLSKILSVVLAISCLSIPTFATEVSVPNEANSTNQEVTEDRNEYLQLKRSGNITIEPNGKMTVTITDGVSASLLDSIKNVNTMIDIGLVIYQQNEYVCPLDQLSESDSFVITADDNVDFSNDSSNQINPFATVCSCNYSPLGLGAMVKRNTNDVRGCFFAMAKIQPSQALAAAMGYWIGKVKPGGDWDYKVKSGYAPYNRKFCCTYGQNNSKKFYHLTSEYIGNYNYAYTGSILFNLDILKLGSGAAAGFDFDKDSADYPAIIEGYNDAKSCGEYLG